jgi:hypothetical protein
MATAGEDPADAELRENRFAYLLQPIRDLAANWDIDIAAELEEYLEELEGITFAIEDCGPSLNFAEAALLIQVRRAGPGACAAPHRAQQVLTTRRPPRCTPMPGNHVRVQQEGGVLAQPGFQGA